MLNKIIRFSLNNRLVVLVGAIIISFAGVYTVNNIEVDVFPDLNAPTVVVMTEAKGMAAEEVERLVTFPIETSVNGATNIRRVRSSSTTGFSVVWVEFDWGTDIYIARQIVSEKLSTVTEVLPDNVGSPVLGPQSSILGEILTVGITSDSTSLLDLRTIADWTIRPRLLSMGGVAQVTVIGGDIKEYQILLDPGRMKHYNVALDEVITAVKGMNQNSSGGILYEYGNEYLIRGLLQTSDLEELSKALVKTTQGAPIILADIADVVIGGKFPKLGLASEKGKEAVLITVTKQPNVSTIDLTKKLDDAIADLRLNLPEDINITTDIFRQERFIESSINNVKTALLEGSFFVVLILLLFLMNVRTTFISLVVLPLSLLVTFLVLKVMGLTINTMSLGGMTIAIGSLVDDAIIDVENVFKRLRENKLLPKEEHKSIFHVVYEASKEVRMPILNSTLIMVASFVPLFFLSGMEGRMLAPLGVSFIVSLLASTFIALTLTPALCTYLLNNKKNKEQKESFVVRNLKSVYSRSLQWALKNKKIVLAGTGLLLVSALIIVSTLGRNFLPPFNEGSFTIMVNTLPGISLEESDKIGDEVERRLLSVEGILTTGRKTGRAELDEHALGVNTSEIEAPFTTEKQTKDEIADQIREKLSSIPGISVEIGQPISHRIDHMLSGTMANIAIKIFGPDLNKLFAIGNDIKTNIDGIEGVTDLNVEQQVERPQLQLKPRRELMAKYGISVPELAEQINVLLAGEVVSLVYEDGKTFDLTLTLNSEYKSTAENIKNIYISCNGTNVPFENLVEIKSVTGPNTIGRENVQRRIVVSANVAGRDLRSVVNDIQYAVKQQVSIPEGYHVEYGGQFESEQAASRTLLIASILSIMVIFLLLYGQFKNVVQSAVILLNLPLALIGGIYSLWFTSGEISIPAIIGFISLFGIATRNGILLMSHYKDLSDQGESVDSSVLKGSLDRLNPIIMTALCSGLALVPLAFQGNLPGNEIQSPMAKVILGGLITSTLLNMYVVPIVYRMLQNRKQNKVVKLTD